MFNYLYTTVHISSPTTVNSCVQIKNKYPLNVHTSTNIKNYITQKCLTIISFVENDNFQNLNHEHQMSLQDLQNQACDLIRKLSHPPEDIPLPDIRDIYNKNKKEGK